jgi:hypothetical protein
MENFKPYDNSFWEKSNIKTKEKKERRKRKMSIIGKQAA